MEDDKLGDIMVHVVACTAYIARSYFQSILLDIISSHRIDLHAKTSFSPCWNDLRDTPIWRALQYVATITGHLQTEFRV